jgi:predicted HNH restriction endonuclease
MGSTNHIKYINAKAKFIACIKLKKSLCKHCQINLLENYWLAEFHHTDPSKKEEAISEICFKGWERVKKELKKCVLLCSNCHRSLHAKGAKIELYKEHIFKKSEAYK